MAGLLLGLNEKWSYFRHIASVPFWYGQAVVNIGLRDADSIHQQGCARFINPQMNVWTTFERENFANIRLTILRSMGKSRGFYDHLRQIIFMMITLKPQVRC